MPATRVRSRWGRDAVEPASVRGITAPDPLRPDRRPPAIELPPQLALREAAVAERDSLEDDAGRKEHPAVERQPLALLGLERDDLDLERVIAPDAVEHLLGLVAELAVALGQQGDPGHRPLMPLRIWASRSLGFTYMV